MQNTQFYSLQKSPYPQTIIIQHMQPYLFQWCLAQYLQMKYYLDGYQVRLVIANARSFLDYDGQGKEKNTQYTQQLIDSFANADKGKYVLVRDSVVDLVTKMDDPVCMLDMRGEKQLSSDQTWSTLIFGGILGDHPPRDRPQPIRKHFSNIRHLGQLQLATDTAVLITRLILNNKIDLALIPLIKQPTIKGLNINNQKTSVQMEGFSYVSKELDIEMGKMLGLGKKERKEIYISDKVRQLLLRDDLDQNFIM